MNRQTRHLQNHTNAANRRAKLSDQTLMQWSVQVQQGAGGHNGKKHAVSFVANEVPPSFCNPKLSRRRRRPKYSAPPPADAQTQTAPAGWKPSPNYKGRSPRVQTPVAKQNAGGVNAPVQQKAPQRPNGAYPAKPARPSGGGYAASHPKPKA